MVGTTVSHFTIVERIGEGGMGVVYRAEDKRLGRNVAIKFLPEALTSDPGAVERFKREARAAAINHPNICTIYDVGEHAGQMFLVMELLEGESLDRRIAQETIRPELVVDWAIEIAAGLEAAHARGMIHRDIKPSNIFATRLDQIKILDFGIVKLSQGTHNQPAGIQSRIDTASLVMLTRPGSTAGTPAYMSPEQIRGDELDIRTDLFSLGIVLYEMATGALPFNGKTSGAMTAAILHEPHQPASQRNPQIHPELERIIDKALEKDRDIRYQHASELRADLRRLKRTYDSRLSTPSSPTLILDRKTSRFRSPRLRSRWILGGAALLLAAAAGVWWATRGPAPLRVAHTVQVTHDGGNKSEFVTDGTRVYYQSGISTNVHMFQVSVRGGDPVEMPPSLAGMFPLDYSTDRSEFLLGDARGTYSGNQAPQDPIPLVAAPIVGGPLRRLGDLMAHSACWSPHGDRIAFARGRDLFVASAEGANPKKLFTGSSPPSEVRWSPDGGKLRFAVFDKNKPRLWDVSVNGGAAKLAFPERNDYQSNGDWSADGSYFFFTAGSDKAEIWVRPERPRLFHKAGSGAVQLTSGPMSSYFPRLTPDGKRVLFYGQLTKGILARYNAAAGDWQPYLSGIPATQCDFSADGKRVAYVGYPDDAIWISGIDGSERRQLTSDIEASKPRWSPDGKQIAFVGKMAGVSSRIYVVPSEGGAARKLSNAEAGPSGDVDPNWLPDGSSIVFSSEPTEGTESSNKLQLWILDLKDRKVSPLQNSQNLWSPRLSPDGKTIVALGFPKWKPILYDVITHQSKEIADATAGWPAWSRDGQYASFVRLPGPSYTRYRVRDGKIETVAFKTWRPAPGSFGWIGLAPDGSVLTILDGSVTDIFALELAAQ